MSKKIASNYFANQGVEVKESGIENAGNGLFTTVPRVKGMRICAYKGERSESKTEILGGDYVLEYKKGHFIDCENSLTCCPGRYINDARKKSLTNCKFVYNHQTDNVSIVATKFIAVGSELFISYGNKEYWKEREK